ncbi:MAG: cyclic nucleotide-binding domain-containing protein [Candidatus Gracilibacteria bacterium]|nr:cyclic nucleotide-binding domain-containing protein [Candidatus Gracilibacteria bacterium]
MRELKVFIGVEDNVIDNILSKSPIEKFKKGDTIFYEGDFSNGKGYIIREGIVGVFVNDVKLADVQKGELFGEIALLSEDKRNATIIALTDVELIVLTLEDLIEMINNNENIINKQIIKRVEENIKLRDNLGIN